MSSKVKVLVELEVDAVKGLDTIACTVKDIVNYELEEGLEVSEIVNISSKEIDVDSFYESGEDYENGVFYKNEEEYRKRNS